MRAFKKLLTASSNVSIFYNFLWLPELANEPLGTQGTWTMAVKRCALQSLWPLEMWIASCLRGKMRLKRFSRNEKITDLETLWIYQGKYSHLLCFYKKKTFITAKRFTRMNWIHPFSKCLKLDDYFLLDDSCKVVTVQARPCSYSNSLLFNAPACFS